MELVYTRDNSRISKEDSKRVQKVIDEISNKTIKELEDANVFVFPNVFISDRGKEKYEDVDETQYVLQKVDDGYKTGNAIGFLGYGKERLIIKSRFTEGGEEGDDLFLKFILEKTLDIPSGVGLSSDASYEERLFSFLIFLFPLCLKEAMRKGLFKVYVRKKYNDERVRGAIDIARHVKKNTPFIGSVAYNRSEFAYDNYLTELVRHTIEYIKTKSYGKRVLAVAREEVKVIAETTQEYSMSDRRKIIERNKRNPARHAYYKEYRSLQTLCIMILQHAKHDIGYGNKKISGVLFDASWLWEEYLSLLLKEYFYHPDNKRQKHTQQFFHNEDTKKQGQIYPDYISKNNEDRIIADAKYKTRENIGRLDYQQILSYMFRFDAKKGYFIYPYPKTHTEENTIFSLNRGTTFEKNVEPRPDVKVQKYGFPIPSGCSNFQDFSDEMEKSEEILIKEFMPQEPEEHIEINESPSPYSEEGGENNIDIQYELDVPQYSEAEPFFEREPEVFESKKTGLIELFKKRNG